MDWEEQTGTASGDHSWFRGSQTENSSNHRPRLTHLRRLQTSAMLKAWAYSKLRLLWKLLKQNTQQRSWASILMREFIFLNFKGEVEYLPPSSSHALIWSMVVPFCSFCQSFRRHYLVEHPPKEKTMNS